MNSKLKVLASSLRFWQLTLAAAAAFVAWVEVHGFKVVDLLNAVAAWSATVAGVGTIDKLGKSVGAGKA